MDVKYNTEKYPNFRSIREWRSDEQPREKLIMHGADKLSDSELLAILIRHGTKGKSAIDVARNLLDKYKNLTELAKLDVKELQFVKGLGDAKAVAIAAAFELGKRVEMSEFIQKRKITKPQDLAEYFIPKLRDKRNENFYVVLMNTAGQITDEVLISEGTLNATIIHPREVFRKAITGSAASVALVHNHPSGNPAPSKEDRMITKELADAGNIIGIKVVDHIIVGEKEYFSFAEDGLL